MTYGAALAIDTDLSNGVRHSFAFGCMLVAVNLVVLGLAFAMGVHRFRKRQAHEHEKNAWRRDLKPRELAIIKAVMGFAPTQDTPEVELSDAPTANSGGLGKSIVWKGAPRLLQKLLLRPADVVMTERIGAGAFGEVFKGSHKGQEVAIKTILSITEETARLFRAEILLTGTLRHPCIVNCVGACWDKQLVCLVLEWAPKGTLAELLYESSKDNAAGKASGGGGAGGSRGGGRGTKSGARAANTSAAASAGGCGSQLAWEEPLLDLAVGVARGMAYLHQCEYFDESAGCTRPCIIHRCAVSLFVQKKKTVVFVRVLLPVMMLAD